MLLSFSCLFQICIYYANTLTLLALFSSSPPFETIFRLLRISRLTTKTFNFKVQHKTSLVILPGAWPS